MVFIPYTLSLKRVLTNLRAIVSAKRSRHSMILLPSLVLVCSRLSENEAIDRKILQGICASDIYNFLARCICSWILY